MRHVALTAMQIPMQTSAQIPMQTPLHTLDFWFDPISPYAWLAFEALPQTLEGFSVQVNYRPILFAGLLQHWGQKGPAEIAPKRAWTYRDVAWRAHQGGLTLDLPAQHPFNPLALLRLALASAPAGGLPNRRVTELIFRHVWQGGADALAPERLAALEAAVAPQRGAHSAEVKEELRAATADALSQGHFGVPTLVLQGRAFWGAQALPMLRAALAPDPWFDGPAWAAAQNQAAGAVRRGVGENI